MKAWVLDMAGRKPLKESVVANAQQRSATGMAPKTSNVLTLSKPVELIPNKENNQNVQKKNILPARNSVATKSTRIAQNSKVRSRRMKRWKPAAYFSSLPYRLGTIMEEEEPPQTNNLLINNATALHSFRTLSSTSKVDEAAVVHHSQGPSSISLPAIHEELNLTGMMEVNVQEGGKRRRASWNGEDGMPLDKKMKRRSDGEMKEPLVRRRSQRLIDLEFQRLISSLSPLEFNQTIVDFGSVQVGTSNRDSLMIRPNSRTPLLPAYLELDIELCLELEGGVTPSPDFHFACDEDTSTFSLRFQLSYDGLRDTGPIQKKQQQQKIQIMFQPKAQGPSTAWLNAYVLVPSTELSGSGKTRKIINTVEVTGTGNNVDVHLESEKLQSTEKLLLPEMRRTRSSSRPSSPISRVSVGVAELLFPSTAVGCYSFNSVPVQNWSSIDQEIVVKEISGPFSTNFVRETLTPGSFVLLPVKFEPTGGGEIPFQSGSIVLEIGGHKKPVIIHLKGEAYF